MSPTTGTGPLPEECNPPATNLRAPTRNLPNVQDMPADQPAKKHGTAYRFTVLPVLNRRGCKNLILNKTKQCIINVILRCIRVTIVVVGKQNLLSKLRIICFISVHERNI